MKYLVLCLALASCGLPDDETALSSTPMAITPVCSKFPIPFAVGANHGTYKLTCTTQGPPTATINWTDGASYPHSVVVGGDIYAAWTAGHDIVTAMTGTPSSLPGNPVLGMPFESPVCRDAACTQSDMTFDRGWVHDVNHVLTFTRDTRDVLHYSDVRATSYHNSFEKPQPLWDILTYYRVRSLEFDFHTTKYDYLKRRYFQTVGHGAPNGADWFVYHYQAQLTDDQSRCFRMSDCMKALKAWHDQNPYHEVITVFGDAGVHNTFLDIGVVANPAWDDSHRPEDFDDRIQRDLAGNAPDGTPILFTPRRLIEWCNAKLGGERPAQSLVDAIHRCKWPTLKELRGHILWVITTKDDDLAYGVRPYLDPAHNGGHPPAEMAAFGIDEVPIGSPDNSRADVVFFNFGNCDHINCYDDVRQSDRDNVRATHDNGLNIPFITRLYSNDENGDPNASFSLAKRTSIHAPATTAPTNFIATHNAADSVYFHTRPANNLGYPFECIDGGDKQAGLCPDASWIESSAPTVRLVGSSGAIESSSELSRFQANDMPPNSRIVLTSGVIGDRLEHAGVYGCIEARKSVLINDAFVALCRVNQQSQGGARLFWRSEIGAPIQSRDLRIDDGRFPGYDGFGVDQRQTVFLKLSIFRDATLHTHAIAYTSRDGVTWGDTGSCGGGCDYTVDFTITDPLLLEGVSLATNNQGIFEFFFQNPTLRVYSNATSRFDPGDGTLLRAVNETSALMFVPVGNGAFGDYGDGLGMFP